MKSTFPAPTLLLFLLFLSWFSTCSLCFEKLEYGCFFTMTGQNHVAVKTNNTNHVIDNLLKNVAATNFATASTGHGDDTVYGLLQCRADVSRSTCARCANDAVSQLKTLCVISNTITGGGVWFDYCFLRYNTDNFLGIPETGFAFFDPNGTAVIPNKVEEFRKTVKATLLKASKTAANIPSSRGLGTAQSTALLDGRKVYVMSECTRDLSPGNCTKCLDFGVRQLLGSFNSTIITEGARFLLETCSLRYQMYPYLLNPK